MRGQDGLTNPPQPLHPPVGPSHFTPQSLSLHDEPVGKAVIDVRRCQNLAHLAPKLQVTRNKVGNVNVLHDAQVRIRAATEYAPKQPT